MDTILPSSITLLTPTKMSPDVHIYDASNDGSYFTSPVQEDMIKTTILELPETPGRLLPPKKKKKKRNVIPMISYFTSMISTIKMGVLITFHSIHLLLAINVQHPHSIPALTLFHDQHLPTTSHLSCPSLRPFPKADLRHQMDLRHP